MSELPEVDLLLAYYWRCPSCKRKNFVVPVNVEVTEEDKEVIKEELGIAPWESFDDPLDDLVMAPAIVTCKKCLVKYRALDAIEQDD